MSLSVVALISGGKDSLFSILHCIANGHKVVALANLYPADLTDDMDSFMYQTIGHKVIPLYEQALALPLYRHPIRGTTENSDKSYTVSLSDEVEDMTTLLRIVQQAHPEVNAVCTGAILSDYQRTRVESVAVRLGLTSLSYLWQFPFLPPYLETSLLADMHAVGQDARIIKAASGDLDERDLWSNVASEKFRAKAHEARRWGVPEVGSALGEGGEYETLAIAGPSPLWKKKIIVGESSRSAISGEAGSYSLRLTDASLEPISDGRIESPRIPDLFDVKFAKIRDRVMIEACAAPYDTTEVVPREMPAWQIQQTGTGRAICNAVGSGSQCDAQMRSIMDKLTCEYHIKPSQIVSTTIILHSMTDFPLVNTVYGSHFKTPNPPARVTISCGDCLPAGVLVSLSVLAVDDPGWRSSGLHVQSRSYWAPANIGPYSQAIEVPLSWSVSEASAKMIHVAGQIPLEPATMEPYEADGFASTLGQTLLSLQHLWRIGRVMRVRHWLGVVAFIDAKSSACQARQAAAVVNACWTEAHRAAPEQDTDEVEAEDFDVWHLQNRVRQLNVSEQTNYVSEISTDFVPPCFTAEVQELPRKVSVEWHSLGFALPGTAQHKTMQRTSEDGTHTTINVDCNGSQVVIAGYLAVYDTGPNYDLPHLALKATTVYTTRWSDMGTVSNYKAQVIPCRSIWDSKGKLVHTLIAYKVF